MNIVTIVALFLMAMSVIFGFAAWRDYRKAGGEWTLAARIRRKTALVFGAIGIGLLLFALLSRE